MTSRIMIVFLIVVLLGFLFLQMKFSGVGWGMCVVEEECVSYFLKVRFIDDDFRLHSA